MFDEKKIKMLHKTFNRIFALPITRFTFKEMQMAIGSSVNGDEKTAQVLFEALLTGKVDPDLERETKTPVIRRFVEAYSIKALVAKDVHEHGDFLSLVNSDVIPNNKGSAIFINRIRRVDGKELHFMTEINSTIQLLRHMVERLLEAKKNEHSKKILAEQKKEILILRQRLDKLIAGETETPTSKNTIPFDLIN